MTSDAALRLLRAPALSPLELAGTRGGVLWLLVVTTSGELAG